MTRSRLHWTLARRAAEMGTEIGALVRKINTPNFRNRGRLFDMHSRASTLRDQIRDGASDDQLRAWSDEQCDIHAQLVAMAG